MYFFCWVSQMAIYISGSHGNSSLVKKEEHILYVHMVQGRDLSI